jgi:Icc-related predicted phosphoesterase
MRIRVLSDLHLEFFSDAARYAFVMSMNTDCDVLALAGDVSNVDGIRAALTLICHRFENVQVLFVAGNHEYYGGSRSRLWGELDGLFIGNLHVLDDSAVKIGGVFDDTPSFRFVGATLWFANQNGPEWALNDFNQIEGLRSWVYEENARTVRFLTDTLRSGDILITHHLPSPVCVHPKYAGSPINAFFVHDMSALIEERKPALAIHGHTHESVDVTVGATRFLCNPYGYDGHEVNPNFDPGMTVVIA